MRGWMKPWRFDQDINHTEAGTAPSTAEPGPDNDKSQPTATVQIVCADEAQTSTIPSNSKKGKKGTVFERFHCVIYMMLIFAAATFTVHYYQEKRPKAFYFTDGRGLVGAPGSCLDCFRTTAPKDRYRFWSTWSAAQEGQIENLLALVKLESERVSNKTGEVSRDSRETRLLK